MAVTPQCSSRHARFSANFAPLGLNAGLHTPIPFTKQVPFQPVFVEGASGHAGEHFQSIVQQEPYTNASFEELRFVDYFNDLQFGGAHPHDMAGDGRKKAGQNATKTHLGKRTLGYYFHAISDRGCRG